MSMQAKRYREFEQEETHMSKTLTISQFGDEGIERVIPRVISQAKDIIAEGNTLTEIGTDKVNVAGPSVRRFARELGISLEYIRGSGPRGRISKQDVKREMRKGQ